MGLRTVTPRRQVTEVSAAVVPVRSGRWAIETRVEIGGAAWGASVRPLDVAVGRDQAVARAATVTGGAASLLEGRDRRSLGEVDAALRGDSAADGSAADGWARLDARDRLGVSMAAARAFAAADGVALYRWLPHLAPPCLPVPHFDVVRGGRHAEHRVDFGGFAIVPFGAPSFAEARRAGARVHGRFGEGLRRIGFRTPLGDDGVFTPGLQAPGDVLDLLCEAIADAGYATGPGGIGIALDVSAAWLRDPQGTYRVNGVHLDAVDMVEYLAHLVDRYPVTSIEDGVADDDVKGWRLLAERFGDRVQLIAGERLVEPTPTADAEMLHHRAVSIELSRAGTVSEMLEAVQRRYDQGVGVVVSQRAREGDGSFVADFAVGVGCGQIGGGAPVHGARAGCFDRLETIEAAEGDLPYARVRP